MNIHAKAFEALRLGDLESFNKLKIELDNEQIQFDIAETDLSNTVLKGINLSKSNLRAVNFYRCNLDSANLSGAYLYKAFLSEASLKETDLSGTNLVEAEIVNSDLSGANLTGANLSEAYMTGSNLKSAELRNIITKDTDFTGVLFDHDVILPETSIHSSEETFYSLRFFYDYTGFCLWSNNSKAIERFGYAIDHNQNLGLSEDVILKTNLMLDWFLKSINMDDPTAPCDWSKDECDWFNQETQILLNLLRNNLGQDFEIIDESRLIEP
jgi:hypothetical protein